LKLVRWAKYADGYGAYIKELVREKRTLPSGMIVTLEWVVTSIRVRFASDPQKGIYLSRKRFGTSLCV